jgi:hypothetical protein
MLGEKTTANIWRDYTIVTKDQSCQPPQISVQQFLQYSYVSEAQGGLQMMLQLIILYDDNIPDKDPV